MQENEQSMINPSVLRGIREIRGQKKTSLFFPTGWSSPSYRHFDSAQCDSGWAQCDNNRG